MPLEYHNRLFASWAEWDSGRTYSGLTLIDCEFQYCILSLNQEDLSLRPRVTNALIKNCEQVGCSFTGAVLEDSTIDGLKTQKILQTWASVFRHVTLRGPIDRLMLSDLFHPGYPTSSFQKVVTKTNADYYRSVDWALDIREAEFTDFDCRGVPSRLVRRDPETQIMVTRERVLASGEHIAAGGEYWHGLLKLFLQDSGYADAILLAPKRHRRFKELAAGLKELRHFDVAEPD